MKDKVRKNFSIVKLIMNIFMGQPVGIVICLFSPIIVFVVMPYLFNGVQNVAGQSVDMKVTLQQTIPGLLMLPSLLVSLLGVPMTMSTLKETTTLKKIKILKINAINIIIAFLISFFGIIVVSTIFLYIISQIIWGVEAPVPNGFKFLVPWLIFTCVSMATGLFISNFTKGMMTSFAIGLAVFLPILFLSGVMFFQMNGWIEKFSKIVPQNHLVQIYNVAWFENKLEIQNYKMPYNPFSIRIQLFDENWKDTIIAYLYPFLFFSVIVTLNIKFFKWE